MSALEWRQKQGYRAVTCESQTGWSGVGTGRAGTVTLSACVD